MSPRSDPNIKPEPVVAWAHAQGYNQFELIRDTDWSQLWGCLDGRGVQYILKYNRRRDLTSAFLMNALWPKADRLCPRLHASDPERGWYIYEFIPHLPGRAEPKGELRRELLGIVLEKYGTLQNRVVHDADLLNTTCHFEVTKTVDRVIAMAVRNSAAIPGNPFSYLGADERARCAQTLATRRDALCALFTRLEALLPTLNHTDLHLANVIWPDAMTPVIVDWDGSVTAAPGLSLHAEFHSARRVANALDEANAQSDTPYTQEDRDLLCLYIDALAQNGRYDRQTLRSTIPIAVLLGQFHYLNEISHYPYAENHQAWARNLARSATKDARAMLNHQPENAMLAAGYKQVRNADDPPNNVSVFGNKIPELHYTTLNPQEVDDDIVTQGARLFKENGCLIIKNCFEPDFVNRLYKEFTAQRDQHITDINTGRVNVVGSLRYMFSVPAEGAYGDAQLIAAPRITAVLRKLLGSTMILQSMSGVVAAPNAEAQHWHRDNDYLFPEINSHLLPAFSITAIVPILSISEAMGHTEMFPGSHIVDNTKISEHSPPISAKAQLGDCYLMDVRLIHRGRPNTSRFPRPIISLNYARNWYRDPCNFTKQARFTISPETVRNLPKKTQGLVTWALQK